MGAEPVSVPNQPVVTPPAVPAQPKLEIKGNEILLDGRKLVYESDLMAAKEGLRKQSEEAQKVHNESMDKAKLELSDAQQQIAKANAELKSLQEASKSGAAASSNGEVDAKVKQELEAAIKAAGEANASSLELRKKVISLTYNIPVDQLKDKNKTQLDSFEEALKALAGSRGGPGAYAVGGGSGAVHEMAQMDRAKAVLSATPVRGIRNESNK